jgi:hypothetical protein
MVALASRAALRVLPVPQVARKAGLRGDFFTGILLRVFRATGVAWAAAKYPAKATKPEAAVRAIGFNDEALSAT